MRGTILFWAGYVFIELFLIFILWAIAWMFCLIIRAIHGLTTHHLKLLESIVFYVVLDFGIGGVLELDRLTGDIWSSLWLGGCIVFMSFQTITWYRLYTE